MPTPPSPTSPVKKKLIHHAIAVFLESVPEEWKIVPKSIIQPGGRRVLVLAADKPKAERSITRGSVWDKYLPPAPKLAKAPKHAAPGAKRKELTDDQLVKKMQKLSPSAKAKKSSVR